MIYYIKMFKSNSIAFKKLISVAVIAFAIPLTVFLVIKGLKLLSHAALSPVTLSFSQNPIVLNTTTPTSVNVVLNAGTNQIGFVAVNYTFDPTKVKLTQEITTTTALKTIPVSTTTMAQANQTGNVTITLALSTADVANPPTGSFQIASMSLQAISANQASSTMAFVPANTQVVDAPPAGVQPTSLTVNVTNSTVSGSATPSPVPSVTPTPIATHTPTPVPTPTSATGQPDLVVTNVSWSPLSPSTGSGVTFQATIKNQGTADTPSGVIHGIAFEVDGTEVTWSDNNTTSLAAGASRTQTANGGKLGTATWTATTGTHQITAWVDDVNRIPELNDSNNTLLASMVVAPATTPTPVPTVTPTPSAVPTASPSPVPTATATPVAQVNFSLKFQGITGQGSSKAISFVVKNGSTTVFTNNSVTVSSNSSGLYTGSVSNITPGTYDIYVKDPTHLSRKFASVTLTNGANSLDLTSKLLLTGDFDNNNSINILDIAQMLSQYVALSTPVNQTNSMFDVNNDGNINILDIAVVLSNYTQLEVLGE
jgi:hypothetical protein